MSHCFAWTDVKHVINLCSESVHKKLKQLHVTLMLNSSIKVVMSIVQSLIGRLKCSNAKDMSNRQYRPIILWYENNIKHMAVQAQKDKCTQSLCQEACIVCSYLMCCYSVTVRGSDVLATRADKHCKTVHASCSLITRQCKIQCNSLLHNT